MKIEEVTDTFIPQPTLRVFPKSVPTTDKNDETARNEVVSRTAFHATNIQINQNLEPSTTRKRDRVVNHYSRFSQRISMKEKPTHSIL